MKKLIPCVAVLVLLLSITGCAFREKPIDVEINGQPCEISGYSEIDAALLSLLKTAGNDNIRLYDCSELTVEILENRCGTTIVERCIGIVTDKHKGDGRILNLPDGFGYYISYRGIYRPIAEGTIMLSYMVYNPDNNYTDDIMERYDFVLNREWED